MTDMLTQTQWRALRRLYIAGKTGIPADGSGYGAAGTWDALLPLRDHEPPLVREVFRTVGHYKGQYMAVITDAGVEFYDKNERRYNLFYPPEK
ncbi:MAG: hypothetical protein JXQ72_04120 [Anaerolineae bacterium]|nr:hypothetical protein [Anaerolineae bacterium]